MKIKNPLTVFITHLAVSLLFISLFSTTVLSHEGEDHSVCDPSQSADYIKELRQRTVNTYLMYAFLALGILLIIIAKARYNPLKNKIEKSYTKMCKIFFIVGIVLLLLGLNQQLRMHNYNLNAVFFGLPGSTHEHADFKVYVNGELLNFSDGKYIDEDSKSLDRHVHIHDNREIVHKHSKGATLGYFFKTLNFEFTKKCFITDTENFCTDKDNVLLFFVNGKANSEYGNYEIKDLDRILITYGKRENSAERIVEELKTVGNDSCLHSGKCLERGDESLSEGCTV